MNEVGINNQTNLTGCRSSWSAFYAKHNLPETAIAFSDGTPIFAWCLHHEVLVEPLTQPIAKRISYILSKKPQDQHELRFLNLRPVSRENTETVAAALAEYRKAWAAAWAEYVKARAAAGDEYRKTEAAYVAAGAALSEALTPSISPTYPTTPGMDDRSSPESPQPVNQPCISS